MKKITVLLLLFLSVSGFAQVSFGIKGGLNLSNIATKSSNSALFTVDTKVDAGFHAGVYVRMKLSGDFYFIPELQYTRRGYVSDDFFSSERTHTHLSYVEIPLLISYVPIKEIAIEAGPSVSRIVRAVSKTETKSNKIDDSFFDNKNDVGINAGLRVNVTEKFSLIGRYYFGLISFEKIEFRDNNNNRDDIKMYNRGAQFGVSYQLK